MLITHQSRLMLTQQLSSPLRYVGLCIPFFVFHTIFEFENLITLQVELLVIIQIIINKLIVDHEAINT